MKILITILTLIISFNALSIGGDGTEKYIQVCTKIGGDGTENKIGGDGTENKIGGDGTENKAGYDGTEYTTYCQIIPTK